MSVTYDIGCTECKKHLWIAQSSACFYYGEKHTMEKLGEFLFAHRNHPLVFANSEDFWDNELYEEIANPAPSKEVEKWK